MSERRYVGREGHNVLVIDEDGAGRSLTHHVRHSPTGFSWGYEGSGPAELARCLLIDVLKNPELCVCLHAQERHDRSGCQDCDWSTSRDNPEHGFRVAHDASAMCCYGDATREDYDELVSPSMYQAFKREVIARFPGNLGWDLTESDIRAFAAAWQERKARA